MHASKYSLSNHLTVKVVNLTVKRDTPHCKQMMVVERSAEIVRYLGVRKLLGTLVYENLLLYIMDFMGKGRQRIDW